MSLGFLTQNNNGWEKQDVWRGKAAVAAIVLTLVVILRPELTNESLENVRQWAQEISSPEIHLGGDVATPPPAVPQLKEGAVGYVPGDVVGLMLKDEKSGAILFGQNEYQPLPLASITKLLSALVILDLRPDWAATTTVIGADYLDTHVYAGDVYTLGELWQTGLVGSSNKAILSLVNALGLTEEDFVQRINIKAKELGMSGTNLVDPTGWSEQNLATASDIAILIREVNQKEEIRQTLQILELDLYSAERKKQHHLWNTNWLLLGWIPNDFVSVVGKTGYLPASGYNFAARIETASGQKFLVVVLGAKDNESRFGEAKKVVDWASNSYNW